MWCRFQAADTYICKKYCVAESLLTLRHELHSLAELSGREKRTSAKLIKKLEALHPDALYENLGGYGVMAVFDSGFPGPQVLFRADMDALSIAENNTVIAYRSKKPGISHRCGHDGHAAILIGLAGYIASNRPQSGKFLLLFQPAEETGEGAVSVLNDPAYASFNPDYVFAMHNLPGYPENSVIVRNGTFAAASRGMIIKLRGKISHASSPEFALSPVGAMARLMSDLPRLSGVANMHTFSNLVLLTVVYGNIGTPAFGSTPGDAVLMVTLRAYLDSDMDLLTAKAREMVEQVATTSGLTSEISFTEEFPATTNHPEAVEILRHTTEKLSLQLFETGLPFRWSEDFAHFTLRSKGALFGLGAGINHAPLHDQEYDFPDEILETGVKLWQGLYHTFAFGDDAPVQ